MSDPWQVVAAVVDFRRSSRLPARAARAGERRGHAGPLARLHGTRESRFQTSLLPKPLARFAFDAEVTDEHLSALVLWVLIGVVVSLGAWAIASPAYGALFAGVVVTLPLMLARQWSGRRSGRMVAELPDLVDMIGRSLRSGASLSQALREAVQDGPKRVGTDLSLVVSGLQRGQTTSQALHLWVQRVPRPEVRIVAAAVALASRNEAGTTQALDGVSHSLRDRAALEAEIRSHSAQAAASMQALVLLPLVFLAFDVVSSQRTVHFLTRQPVGQLCLVVAVVLNLLGWWWMRSIIRRRSPQ